MDGKTKLRKYRAVFRCSNGYGDRVVTKTDVYATDVNAARLKLVSTYNFKIAIEHISEAKDVNIGMSGWFTAC